MNTKNTFEGVIEENVGGFGSALASVKLHFVVEQRGDIYKRYALHVFHGSPASSDWWRSRRAVAADLPLTEAAELIDTLCGRSGSHQFFDIVNRDGSRRRMRLLENVGVSA